MTPKTQGLAPGQRVRVTFEGEVRRSARGTLSVTHMGWIHSFGVEEVDNPTLHIERIEEPLKVGDRVRDSDGDEGTIRAVHDDDMWVFWDKARRHLTAHRDELERVPS